MGQGQLVVFAAECAKAGASAEKTLAAIEALVPLTRTFALLSDLRYAVRGGRLPAWVKTVADVLRFIPIIRTTTDGRIATASFMLGKRNRIARFVRHIARQVANDGALNIGIGHAICPDDAAELEHHLRKQIPEISRLSVTSLGAGFGVHGGPGTLLVSTQPHTEPPTDD
jgi:DegV family protein with EDD domain